MRATFSWGLGEDVQFNYTKAGERNTVTLASTYMYKYICITSLCYITNYIIWDYSENIVVKYTKCQTFFLSKRSYVKRILMRSLLAKTLAIHNL